MSKRYLIPTNLFHHWEDPTPDNGFPEPYTGDVYFNTESERLRVFHNGKWQDASSGAAGGGSGGDEIVIQGLEPTEESIELWVNPEETSIPASHIDLADLDADTHPQYLKRQKDIIVSTAAASGPPERGTDTVWIQY